MMELNAIDHFKAISNNERDMMNNTKNMVMRSRLNREINFTPEFRERFLTKEYGNYQQYEKNEIKTEVNEENQLTQDNFYHKYLEMMKRLPTKTAYDQEEERREDIKDLMTN